MPVTPGGQTDTVTGTVGGEEVQLTFGLPPYATDTFEVDVDVTEPNPDPQPVNIALAIDTSGSTRSSSGSDVDGDPTTGSYGGGVENFLEAQVFAARELVNNLLDAGYDPVVQPVEITLVDYSSSGAVLGTYTLSDTADITSFNAALDAILAQGPSGATNYADPLADIHTEWSNNGVAATDDNIVIFLSDGEQNTGGQYTDEAQALENDFGASISGIGVGANSSLGDLNDLDNTGGSIGSNDGAQKVVDAGELSDVISAPIEVPELQSVQVFVDGVEMGMFTPGDGILVATPTGYTIDAQEISGYDYSPPGQIDVEVRATFTDGSTVINSNSLSLQTFVCFTRGTRIATKSGNVAIEILSAGDQILTMDHGYQKILWIGSRKLDAIDLRLNPKALPIRIKAGALGDGRPVRDLLVSPQHRMLVRSVIAERMFGESEVLVPANKLLALDGIDIEEDADSVEYFHILFDRHEIILANGALAESLLTGPEALKGLSRSAIEEITTLFPDMLEMSYMPTPARHIPGKGKRIKRLALRHQINHKPLVQELH